MSCHKHFSLISATFLLFKRYAGLWTENCHYIINTRHFQGIYDHGQNNDQLFCAGAYWKNYDWVLKLWDNRQINWKYLWQKKPGMYRWLRWHKHSELFSVAKLGMDLGGAMAFKSQCFDFMQKNMACMMTIIYPNYSQVTLISLSWNLVFGEIC